MLGKIFALGASSLLGISLAGFSPPPPPDDGPPPPPKEGEHGPGGDLKKAYDLLRRLRSDGRTTGRSEERLRDWTERATKLYRDGLRAREAGDPRLAHEYGAAAHDLARAIDHARNAAQYERPDPDLPPPSGPGPEDGAARVRRDLRRAYDRIRDELDGRPGMDRTFYLDAARDLYNAARRDAEAGRQERAGELARAAEAMSHVAEHLGHADDRDRPDEPPPPPDRRRGRPEPPGRERPDDDRLPPPLID